MLYTGIYFWQNETDYILGNILVIVIPMLPSVGKYNFCEEWKHEQYLYKCTQIYNNYWGWGRGVYKAKYYVMIPQEEI